ncbi:MAG: DUF86 domain-containing protein [Bdellovibrionales bacterium]|nr:DUF86 domain-containing protein [Bdellovibrionales bacterium]
MSPRSWEIRIQDILKAISEIEDFIGNKDFEEFSKDIKSVRAVTACFLFIGEAVNHIPKSVKENNPEVPWEQIKGMRNRISHEYFSLDELIIWKTAKDRLPSFKLQMLKLLDSNK